MDRYYDPTTDSFISVDPDVQQTDQPYAFVDDDPLNATDPLGVKGKKTTVTVHVVSYAYTVPVGILGKITVNNVIGKVYVVTPNSNSLVSLQFNNKTISYGNGISVNRPVNFTPTTYVIKKVDGQDIEEGNVVLYASVFGGDPSPPEYDPGPEEVIPPEPAINVDAYQKSVTFVVYYLTPVH